MQLKSLAKVNNALNDINNGSKSSNILDSIGKKYSSDVLKSAISESTLDANQLIVFLRYAVTQATFSNPLPLSSPK